MEVDIAEIAQRLADPDIAFALFGLAVLAVAFGVARRGAPGVAVAVLGVLPGAFLLASPGFSIDPAVGAAVTAGTAVALYVLGRRARRRRRRRASLDHEVLQGRLVVVREASGSRGQGVLAGAWWSLRSTGPPLAVGSPVRVRDIDGLDLVVEPATRRAGTSGRRR